MGAGPWGWDYTSWNRGSKVCREAGRLLGTARPRRRTRLPENRELLQKVATMMGFSFGVTSAKAATALDKDGD